MTDIPHQTPEPGPKPRDRSAFAWTFGVCTALPIIGAGLLLLGGSLEGAVAGLGVYALILAPLLWIGGLIAGLVMRLSGRTARGNGVMLGALAGAVVGFSLCSGVLALLGAF